MIRAVVARTLAVLLVAAASSPRPVRADAVVGTGAADSCTEAALDSALAGGGSVTFNCGASPVTITVTSTKTISADTAIDGGSLITISGGNSVGVFFVNTGVNFTVQNLTIANGNSRYGGAISNYGTVTATNSTFSGNSAGSGGGIFNTGGMLTVTDSTFSGNSAFYGGGINNSGGTLTVTDSTFSGNSAGYGVDAGGGGIFSTGGTVTITNRTFSGNSGGGDGGAILNDGGTLTVTDSTFTGNSAVLLGGSIYNLYGTLTVTNTIVANSASGGNCAGSVTDGGHNIDDGTTCGFTGTGCTATTGTSFCNTNPVLDPTGLQNNGGHTETIALQARSPAINAGDEAVCAAPPVNNLDQRGYVRPGAGATRCSIGAYEYNGLPTCVGDCNGDGTVTVDEILTMVNIALGNTPVTACEAGDANHDGQITVDEILTAVNNALNGCGGG